MSQVQQTTSSPWPRHWALALVGATFPLLWVGGLVTTTDAGMAVPDWPTTYGYNMFLYPWQWWLAAPWDLFVEHGHRMLGATVGMITIGLLIVLWRTETRRWLCWLGVVALLLVIFQGVLGGMRVLLDERTLAMLHGCTAPLFFALAVSLAVFTSPRWKTTSASHPVQGNAGVAFPLVPIRFLAMTACTLIYLQIVVGAVLRHVPVAAEPTAFVHAVRFHLFLAAVLTLHIGVLVWMIVRKRERMRPLHGFATVLGLLLALQLALGAGTWVVKFAAPTWAPSWVAAAGAVQDGGWLKTHIITAHVATGSLLFGVATALALHAQRLFPRRREQQVPEPTSVSPAYGPARAAIRRTEAAT